MLLDLLTPGISAQQIIMLIFAYLVILLIAFPIHECSHAFVAKLLGDDTAFRQGRVTLNPIPHLDPIGTLSILLVGIGWANPVPVNPTRCRKVSARTAMALTAAAGPISNILVSLVFLIIEKILIVSGAANDDIMIMIAWGLGRIVTINLSLAVFNLLPIPPFDGSRILLVFLNEKTYFKIMQYERIIMFAILALCWTGLLNGPLTFLTNGLFNFLDLITRFIC